MSHQPPPGPASRPRRLVYLALPAALLVLLVATTIPGVFTVDEPNYLATLISLRHGRVSLPHTEGLPPSQELAYFDPTARGAGVTTPVVSFAPPLWAVIALPFSLLGLRGLFAINTLAYLAAAGLVFLYARRYAGKPETPWIASGVFLAGTYTLEYAQAIWPHMLALALCLGAYYLASLARRGGPLYLAVAAGLLAGLAAGVRYQDFFFAGLVGLTLLVLGGRRRFTAALAYGCGVALPLAVSATFNFLRFGSWNPISKGPHYFQMTAGAAVGNPVLETLAVFWARVVDYSTRPAQAFSNFAFQPHEETGAHLFAGAVKKAWLQSSPWLAVVLVALLVAWLGRRQEGDEQRTELRAMAMIVWPILALFSVAGFGRTDGFCFNQRYFFELLPLAAVSLAWVVERWRLRRLPVLLGALATGLVAYWALAIPGSASLRYLALLRVPLVLAALLLVGWAVLRWSPTGWRPRHGLAAFALGASLMWSAMAHLGDDLAASRDSRKLAARWSQVLDLALPERAAVFAWGGVRNAVAPLLLGRELVILDAKRDRGESARQLSEALLARGERVFVVANGFPAELLDALRRGRAVSSMSAAGVYLLEVAEPPPGEAPVSPSGEPGPGQGSAGG